MGKGGVIIILYLPNPTPQNVNLVYSKPTK